MSSSPDRPSLVDPDRQDAGGQGTDRRERRRGHGEGAVDPAVAVTADGLAAEAASTRPAVLDGDAHRGTALVAYVHDRSATASRHDPFAAVVRSGDVETGLRGVRPGRVIFARFAVAA